MVKKKHGKVLVLGNDNRSFLTVIRSLGRAGLEVHVAWAPPRLAALKSRYLKRIHDLPRSSTDNNWKNPFIDLLKEERFDLVVPCNDESIIPLQENRIFFEPYGKIYLLENSVFDIFYDKRKTSNLAQSLNISFPREMEVSNATHIEKALSAFDPPVVIKPVSSHNKENITKRRKVIKAFNPDEFRSELIKSLEEGPVVVQENFIGCGTGVEILANEGEILTAFQHLRVHEPLHGGGSSYRKGIPLHQKLFQATAKIVKKVQYTGVGMFEYKWNRDTDEWILIEVNARFWGSLPLPVASGIDFPRFLYEMIVEGRKEFPREYKKNLYCRNFALDIDWMRANLKADRNDPALESRKLWQVAAEFYNFLTLRERSDTLVIDDPAPFWHEFNDLISRAKNKFFTKVK